MQNIQFIAPHSLDYQSDLNSFDNRQQYLRRTIEVKNKNIDELLKELRQTKELYQQYKNQYLAEQKRMKAKVLELSNKLDLQSSQLEKHKLLVGKIKNDYQITQEKERKSTENYNVQVRELQAVKNELEEKFRAVSRESSQLKEKNDVLNDKLTKVEEKWRNSEKELTQCQQQLKSAQEQLKMKSLEWQKERYDLQRRLDEMQQRKKQKSKMNQKLQAIQNKIINTLRKI